MSSVDKQLENLKAEITNELPRDISVSDVKYEGPELVVYTRDPKKFAQNGDLIRKLASKLRKRITVRPDPDVLSDPREAEPKILSVIPEEAGVTDLDFHIDTGEVVIEAEKPGMVIGRHGSTLREITQKVGWTPEVVRTPPIESSTVSNVRNFLKQEREDRRRILERTGRQIHREQLSDDEWVRITTLGCCREVGRASFIVSTPETRILVDCGDKPGSDDVPYLQVPEALGSGANSLDAVVLTHAHLDHSALIPLLFKYGYDGPIYTTEPTRDLMGLLTLDYLDVASKEGRTPPYESEMVREAIKHTIPLEYGDVTDIAPDVKLTFHNAVTSSAPPSRTSTSVTASTTSRSPATSTTRTPACSTARSTTSRAWRRSSSNRPTAAATTTRPTSRTPRSASSRSSTRRTTAAARSSSRRSPSVAHRRLCSSSKRRCAPARFRRCPSTSTG